MKKYRQILARLTILALLALSHEFSPAFAQGTAFTYQGRLNAGGSPANGSYDVAFTLFATNTGGIAIAGPVTNSAVAVTNGLFTTLVDFGNVYTGSSNWLEIAVTTNAAKNFSTLAPRQQLTPVPYAVFANTASNLNGVISGSQITAGSIGSTQLGANAVQAANIANGAIGANQLAAGAAAANLQAGGQSGVAGGGIILSADPNSASLASAGYIKINGTFTSGTEAWNQGSSFGTPINGLASRSEHTAVWDGTEMLIWGGAELGAVGHSQNVPIKFFGDGARYNPATDTWAPISSSGAPLPRSGHSAVWDGTEMIIWGGTTNYSEQNLGAGTYAVLKESNDGARYNPTTDTWTEMNSIGAPSARSGHAAIWTGSRMLIWGGDQGDSTGGSYSPTNDTWNWTTTFNALNPRLGNTVVWDGTEMLVWGGFMNRPSQSEHQTITLNDGARYNPTNNAWTPITTTGAPAPRSGHVAVWDGKEMIVWGGKDYEYAISTSGTVLTNYLTYHNDGGRYNPTNNTWTSISTTGAPSGRQDAAGIWDVNQMYVWGGDFTNYSGFNGLQIQYYNDGASYNPTNNTWTAMAAGGPGARFGNTAVLGGRLHNGLRRLQWHESPRRQPLQPHASNVESHVLFHHHLGGCAAICHGGLGRHGDAHVGRPERNQLTGIFE